MRSHEWIDQRSLALDRAIAQRLLADPSLLDRARNTLARWIGQRQPDPPLALREWQDCLERLSFDEIIALITSDDERARRLRQSSPFCGILPPAERLAIFKQYESRRA